MSAALQALLCICLDANQGTWVPLAWLTQRVGMKREQVLQACDELVACRQMLRREPHHAEGEVHFGVNVDAQSPLAETD